MTELFAFEVYECFKHAPSRTICRTDLYLTEELAKAALLDVETRTAFAFLYDMRLCDDFPFSFSGEYDIIDDYAEAYFDGVEEIVMAVQDLFDWVNGDKEDWVDGYLFEFGTRSFAAHLK